MIFNRWPQQLAQTLNNGRLTPVLNTHLDTLLLWLSHPEHPQVAPLAQALEHTGLSRATAVRQAYSLLDQLLFSGQVQAPSTLGLAANTPPDRAKQRYRRLIQVYHPDRHAQRPLWATQRTERINLAFNAQRRGTHGWTARPSSVPSPTTTAPRAWRLRVPLARWQQIGLALALTSIVIGSGLWFSTPAPRPPRVLITPPLASAPPPAPELPRAELAEIVAVPLPPVAENPAPATAAAPLVAPEQQAEVTTALSDAALPTPATVSTASVPAPAVWTSEPASTAPLAPPLTMPPIAAPQLPAAPLAPQTQPLAAVTALPAPNLAATQIDCELVPAQLQQFQRAYNAGELTQLMALYSPDARENDLADWSSIRQTYAEWFLKTAQRRIQFTKLHIKQTSKHCAVIALYQVHYQNAQQQTTTQTGIIEFLFEQRSTALQILRVRY